MVGGDGIQFLPHWDVSGLPRPGLKMEFRPSRETPTDHLSRDAEGGDYRSPSWTIAPRTNGVV